MHTCLIDAETLTGQLDNPAWAIFDCRYTLTDTVAGRRLYQATHLPGAQYLDLAEDLSGPPLEGSGRHPLPDPHWLARRLGGLGVGPETQVVVYDSGELYYAARAWWLLRWLGHEAAAVLDGGFAAWQAQGRAVTRDIPWSRTAQTLPVQRSAKHLALDTPQVQAELSGKALLLDARAPERYTGASEIMDPVAGHIPGALNRPASRNLGAGGHLRPAAELAAELRILLGEKAPSDVVNYCGSGVSACLNALAMEYAGLPGARLYPGSWSAWCADPTRPVARG